MDDNTMAGTIPASHDEQSGHRGARCAPLRVPALASGLKLHGEYRGSGFVQPQYLARRGDGQVLQMSHLLYLIASEIDGRRDSEDIARRVSGSLGRPVSAANVDYLLDQRLRPMGVAEDQSGPKADAPPPPRANSLLTLVGRKVLISPAGVHRVARVLAWLHRPAIVLPVLVAMVAFDIWLFRSSAAIEAIAAVVSVPPVLLALLGLTLVSLVFHEFGHASACHYSGTTPGAIGFGLYLVWPALYTDVTDVYRASRAGRLRTDLGGLYFNVIYILAMAGCHALTGYPVFLVAAFLIHIGSLQQLLPIIRLDGYFVLSDLVGVPDLFGKVIPILFSVFRRRTDDPRVANLKLATRVVVTIWVFSVCPLLIANLSYAVWYLPTIMRTTVHTLTAQINLVGPHWASGMYASVALDVISLVLLALPSLGLVYLLARLVYRTGRALFAATRGRPRLRAALLSLSAVLFLSLILVRSCM